MFATDIQLQKLTGYKRAADQIRWLTAAGYRFERARTGKPVVLVAEIERHLLTDQSKQPETVVPRFDALRG
jgi:Domain of unknown function (DUF4224)